ncbi:hypothetical protein [uncultured Psychrobacter sp.]|uniref:hypothetical protein n=1 Tax=uncultured Psychrobacter sp. TaxID=259303 RepID=UPI00345A224F
MNNTSNNVIKRQLLIIQYLIQSNYVSTIDIQTHLKSKGMEVQIRTIQRDLNLLNEIVPLEVRTDDKPYSWRWKRLKSTSTHTLSIAQALALRIVETELKGVIPDELYGQLEPLFEKSHFVVALSQGEELDRTDNKPSISTGMGIIPMSPLQRVLLSLRIKMAKKKNRKSERKINSDDNLFNELSEEELKAIETLAKELEGKELGFLSKLLKDKF